jgi:hypothetical protein
MDEMPGTGAEAAKAVISTPRSVTENISST